MKPVFVKALLFGAACTLLASQAANADEITDPTSVPTEMSVQSQMPDAVASAPAVEEAPIDVLLAQSAIVTDDVLAGQRGGQTILLGNQTMTAITSGNILNGDYVAGAVTLSDNALSSFNGIGNLLINTGAQVSLQTGMNLIINVGE